MANSFIILVDLKAKFITVILSREVSEASKEMEERSQLHKTVNSTMMARGTDGIDMILQPTIFMKQKRMSEEVSRESTCPHVSLIICINVTYHVVSLCAPAGSVSASGMLYTGVKKLETVMVDAVCFSTFTSLLIIQS
uniref:Uncharacterized protein n=1 Tax=Brassica oleracea TaxID=3712 RepID=A0A3P6BN09_BRAOL|nr:unnamed protein product [Brassica oleracea]